MTERFDCHHCEESLFGKKYILREDSPYCVACFETLYASTCEECRKPIGCDCKVPRASPGQCLGTPGPLPLPKNQGPLCIVVLKSRSSSPIEIPSWAPLDRFGPCHNLSESLPSAHLVSAHS